MKGFVITMAIQTWEQAPVSFFFPPRHFLFAQL